MSENTHSDRNNDHDHDMRVVYVPAGTSAAAALSHAAANGRRIVRVQKWRDIAHSSRGWSPLSSIGHDSSEER